jgi:flagellar motor switch protein FliM
MAEFQFDDKTQDGPQLAASAEVCRPELLLPGQVELARRAFEKFLGGLAMLFPGYLYLPAEIRFAGVAQQPLTQALSEAQSGPCTVFLELSSFQNSAYLVLGHNFVCTALELLLGAPAEVTGTPRQSLTEVDLHVVQGLAEQVVDELRGAWQSTCGAALRLVSTDPAERFAGAEPDGPSVLVLTAELTLRGSADSIRLMVPSVLVRLASEQVRESATIAAAANRQALFDALDAASLEVEAVLRAGDIRIRDLLRLQPGSILALPRKADMPIEGHVNGVAKLQGELVNTGKSLGFQVWSWPAAGDPSEDSLQSN